MKFCGSQDSIESIACPENFLLLYSFKLTRLLRFATMHSVFSLGNTLIRNSIVKGEGNDG